MGDNVGRGQRKRELSTKKKESLLALKEVAASTSSSKQSSRKSKKDKEVVVMKPTSTVSLAYEKDLFAREFSKKKKQTNKSSSSLAKRKCVEADADKENQSAEVTHRTPKVAQSTSKEQVPPPHQDAELEDKEKKMKELELKLLAMEKKLADQKKKDATDITQTGTKQSSSGPTVLAAVPIDTNPTRQSESNLASGEDVTEKSLCPVNVSLSSKEDEDENVHSIDNTTQSSKSSSSDSSFSDADGDSPASSDLEGETSKDTGSRKISRSLSNRNVSTQPWLSVKPLCPQRQTWLSIATYQEARATRKLLSRAVRSNKLRPTSSVSGQSNDASVFPIMSEIDFEALEVKLQESASYRKEIKNQLEMIGGETWRMMVFHVMKFALSNQVARLYTYYGNPQKAFKDRFLSKVIKAAVQSRFPSDKANPNPGDATDIKVSQRIGEWLTNSKDKRKIARAQRLAEEAAEFDADLY